MSHTGAHSALANVDLHPSEHGYRCSICDEYLLDYNNCNHWPGLYYTIGGVKKICRPLPILKEKDARDDTKTSESPSCF